MVGSCSPLLVILNKFFSSCWILCRVVRLAQIWHAVKNKNKTKHFTNLPGYAADQKLMFLFPFLFLLLLRHNCNPSFPLLFKSLWRPPVKSRCRPRPPPFNIFSLSNENKNILCSKICGGKNGLQTLSRLNLAREQWIPLQRKLCVGNRDGKT